MDDFVRGICGNVMVCLLIIGVLIIVVGGGLAVSQWFGGTGVGQTLSSLERSVVGSVRSFMDRHHLQDWHLGVIFTACLFVIGIIIEIIKDKLQHRGDAQGERPLVGAYIVDAKGLSKVLTQ